MPTISANYRVKPDAQRTVKFRTKSVSFGDGYEQRSPDGINTIQETWQVTFILESVSERDGLEAILKDAAGVKAIAWQAPDAPQPKEWLVRTYPVSRLSNNGHFEISCTLEQVN